MRGPRPLEGSSIILSIRGRICRDNSTRAGQPGTSANAEVHRIASEIDGVRERSNGADPDWRDAINRSQAVEGRKRDEAERLRDSLGGAEGRRYGIIAKIQGFRY